MTVRPPMETHDLNIDPRKLRRQQFFFIYGDDQVKMENLKLAIVHAHLSEEEREENYNEYGALGSQVSLSSILGDVIAELSTESFLPGSKRVVALYGVRDFYGGKESEESGGTSKKKKGKGASPKSSSEILADFVRNTLPSMPSVLIVIAPEDYERGRTVSTKNPVYAAAKESSSVYHFREQAVQYAFFDALFARDTATALQLWRQWRERVGNQPRPYFALVSQLRLLLQAKILASRLYQKKGIDQETFITTMLPPDRNANIAMQPDWLREKFLRQSRRFSLGELMESYEKLEILVKYAVPLSSDPSVPNRDLLSEIWITEFCAKKELG